MSICFFEISLAQPLTDEEVENSLVALDDAIQAHLVPLLAGCPLDPPSSTRRHLFSDRLRYMIGDAIVAPSSALLLDDDEVCGEGAPTPCFLAETNADFYLKGDETAFSLLELISIVFARSGEESLALPSNVVTKISLHNVVAVDSTDPASPTSPPTIPVVIPNPVKLEYLETVLSAHQPLDTNVVTWLSALDTWEPTSDVNVEEQWAERYAIATIYESTNGDDWISTAGWKSSNHICQGWFGISCTDNRVTDLDLPNNNMTGSLPTELGILEKGKNLDMRMYHLPAPFATMQYSAPNMLFVVHAAGNEFIGDIPTEIGVSQESEPSIDIVYIIVHSTVTFLFLF